MFSVEVLAAVARLWSDFVLTKFEIRAFCERVARDCRSVGFEAILIGMQVFVPAFLPLILGRSLACI